MSVLDSRTGLPYSTIVDFSDITYCRNIFWTTGRCSSFKVINDTTVSHLHAHICGDVNETESSCQGGELISAVHSGNGPK